MILQIWNHFYCEVIKKINFSSLKNIFFIFSLIYFSIFFLKNFRNLSFEFDFEKNGINIFLSFLFCILSIYSNAIAWKNIVIWFGKINVKNNIVSFYVLTNILKYVPGGFWHFVERFSFIKDISNPQLAFYSTIIEPYFMLCASSLLGMIGIVISPFYLFLFIPSVFLNRKLIYFVLRNLESLKVRVADLLQISNSGNDLQKRIRVITFFPTKALFFEINFILLKFVGFFICFKSVYSLNSLNALNFPDIVFLLVIFCLSWSVGLIVPTSPSGVGVFEACFLFLAGEKIPQNIILISLIYFRLISTSADLLLSFPFIFKKLYKRI